MGRDQIVRLEWDIAGMVGNILTYFDRAIDDESHLKEGAHQFFCDGETWDFFINQKTISGEVESGHFLHRNLGLIPVTVTIEIGGKKRNTSGFHEYDEENEEHPGIIIVNHTENIENLSRDEIKIRSRSAVSHELYHAARWFIDQVPGTQDLTLEAHAEHVEEIGARIQEAISIMPNTKNPSDSADFKPYIVDIVEYYLIRNNVESSISLYNDLREHMISRHMEEYRKSLGLF
jgi:hypothetical protein